MQAPRREPGDDVGRFGMDAALSPCLRMGAFMSTSERKPPGASRGLSGVSPICEPGDDVAPIKAPRREPGDDPGRFGMDAALSPCLRMGAFIQAHCSSDAGTTPDRPAGGAALRLPARGAASSDASAFVIVVCGSPGTGGPPRGRVGD